MIWLVLVVAVVLVALTVAAVLGRVDGSLDDATTTLSHEPLPQTPLTPGDIAELHFDTAMRGYRMNQVDGVLDRLRREVADLGDEVVRLRPAEEPQEEPQPDPLLEATDQPEHAEPEHADAEHADRPEQPLHETHATPPSFSDRS